MHAASLVTIFNTRSVALTVIAVVATVAESPSLTGHKKLGLAAIEQYQLQPKRIAPRGETSDYQTLSGTPATGPDHPQTHIATTKVTDNTADKFWLHTHTKCANTALNCADPRDVVNLN